MSARLNLMENPLIGKFQKHIIPGFKIIGETGLPATTQNLVMIRVSQINGCGPCTEMHTKEAIAAGETVDRLNLIAVWPEATPFNEAERAALQLAEQGTRIADAAPGVSDEAWLNAAKHYNEEQLTGLVLLIGIMNTVNRLNVMTRQPTFGYQAGQVSH